RTVSVASTATSATDSVGSTSTYSMPPPIYTYSVKLYRASTSGDVLLQQWGPNGVTSGSATATLPPILNFTGQSTAAKTLRLSYWPVSDTNNITEIDLASYASGTL